MNERVYQKVSLPTASFDEETVFFNSSSGKYHSTGPVGAEILLLLESPRTLKGICDQLVEKFDVDADICRQEVSLFLDKMIQEGILA